MQCSGGSPHRPVPARAKSDVVCRLTRMLMGGDQATFLDRASGERWRWLPERCIFDLVHRIDGVKRCAI